ncbi:MAG: thioredoxin [Holosporales bacterium]|jgi:thioredoxin 1|nr:thioredoxin [Holosporales bacterium]
MALENVTDTAFATDVLEAQVPVLVDFYADWCGPCRMIAPILEEISVHFSENLKIYKLNIDKNPQTPIRYDVMSVPTLLLFKDGVQCAVSVGSQSKNKILTWLTPHLSV